MKRIYTLWVILGALITLNSPAMDRDFSVLVPQPPYTASESPFELVCTVEGGGTITYSQSNRGEKTFIYEGPSKYAAKQIHTIKLWKKIDHVEGTFGVQYATPMFTPFDKEISAAQAQEKWTQLQEFMKKALSMSSEKKHENS